MLSSAINAGRSSVDFNICKQCRRFWLERDGWLLSKRETMNILREWPAADTVAR